MRVPPVPLESDDRVTFVQCGQVLIACAHDQEEERTFALVERHLRAVHRACGAVAFLFIVEHEKGPPPRFAENAGGVLRRTAAILPTVSTALLAEGFVASIYRSVGGLLIAMVGRRDTLGVHGSVEAACDWLLARLSPGPHVPDRESLVGSARRITRKQRPAGAVAR